MRNALNIFMVILIIQLFYAISINIATYSLPSVTNNYIDQANSISGQVNIEYVPSKMEGSFGNQLNIPVIELGALVFYSGNFLVDLLLNFLTALPQLISLVLYLIFSIIGADAQIIYYIQLFLTGIVTIYYFMSLMTLLTNIRGRGSII
jgi:hypothetical protein